MSGVYGRGGTGAGAGAAFVGEGLGGDGGCTVLWAVIIVDE